MKLKFASSLQPLVLKMACLPSYILRHHPLQPAWEFSKIAISTPHYIAVLSVGTFKRGPLIFGNFRIRTTHYTVMFSLCKTERKKNVAAVMGLRLATDMSSKVETRSGYQATTTFRPSLRDVMRKRCISVLQYVYVELPTTNPTESPGGTPCIIPHHPYVTLGALSLKKPLMLKKL